MYRQAGEQSSTLPRPAIDENQIYSTIRKTHRPFRKPTEHGSVSDSESVISTAGRQLTRSYQQADRQSIQTKSESVEKGGTTWQAMKEGGKLRRGDTSSSTTPRCLKILSLTEINQGQSHTCKYMPAHCPVRQDREEQS